MIKKMNIFDFIDDDYKHLTKISLECDVDKDHPRTEIFVNILD